MPEPIAVRVTRYQCPPCGRTHSSRQRAVEHMGRCWRNPEARGCLTCRHFDQFDGEPDVGLAAYEECEVGVSLAGQPAFEFCATHGADMANPFGPPEAADCPDCRIDGNAVKPGPIVHCEKWEAADADR